MTDWIRELIEDRRKIFKTDKGRSQRWHSLKKKTSRIVKKRKKNHDNRILEKFQNEMNPGKFFEHINSLLAVNETRWSLCSVFPECSEAEVAERFAAFFNNISNEYVPLDLCNTPVTFSKPLPVLTQSQVAEKLRKAKKTSSMLPGDISPNLYNLFSDLLAIPIEIFFNAVGKWPSQWKTEFVAIIPKGKSPQTPAECRNISCTNTVYESFVLQWSRELVVPKLNKYGGEPGASSTQLLIEVIDDITTGMEDNRAAVVLSALDFSKAFNRLEHSKCLQSFAQRGASSEIIALLALFLAGRVMTVRVGKESSTPRQVNAGAPQGSVLGCYLFNIGIDSLEEGFSPDGLGQEDTQQETLNRTDDFPAASTPVRVQPKEREVEMSPIAGRYQAQGFELLPRVANAPPWARKPKDPAFKEGTVKTYKYVADETNTSIVNIKRSKLMVKDGLFFKEVTDLRAQGLLQHISDAASNRGMKINAEKQVQCVCQPPTASVQK